MERLPHLEPFKKLAETTFINNETNLQNAYEDFFKDINGIKMQPMTHKEQANMFIVYLFGMSNVVDQESKFNKGYTLFEENKDGEA